jgi:regulatory protein
MNKEAYNYCIRLLSRRDYSRYKLGKKLKERDYSPEESEEVLDKLIEQNYLREEEYARIRTRHFITKGYSNNMILRAASEEFIDVDEQLIESLRAEYGQDQADIISELIQKKIRNKTVSSFEEKMKLKQKVTRFLLSKGHQYSEVSSKIDQAIQEISDSY